MSPLKNLKIPANIKWKLSQFKANNKCVTYGDAIKKLLDNSRDLEKIKKEMKA